MKSYFAIWIATFSFSAIAGPAGNETPKYPAPPRVGYSDQGPLEPGDAENEATAVVIAGPTHEVPSAAEALSLTRIHYATFATIASIWKSGHCGASVDSQLLKSIQSACENALSSTDAIPSTGIFCQRSATDKSLRVGSSQFPGATYTLNARGEIREVDGVPVAVCGKLATAYKATPDLCSMSAALLAAHPKMPVAGQLAKITACTRWAPGDENARVFASFRRCAIAK